MMRHPLRRELSTKLFLPAASSLAAAASLPGLSHQAAVLRPGWHIRAPQCHSLGGIPGRQPDRESPNVTLNLLARDVPCSPPPTLSLTQRLLVPKPRPEPGCEGVLQVSGKGWIVPAVSHPTYAL